MKTLLNPYLSFKDNAREAMEFYHSVFGGELGLHTFKEFLMSEDPSEENLIMHSMVEATNGLTFMASDTPKRLQDMHKPGQSISMSLSGDNEEELRGYWSKLSEGGTINMPLEKAPWGDTFGMVTDKFGIQWMVDIGPEK